MVPDKSSKDSLRTYRRRLASRTSGFHTCDEQTGGECIIKSSQRLYISQGTTEIVFHRSNLELVNLFQHNIGIVAFGGFIYSPEDVNVAVQLKCDSHEPIFIEDYSLDPFLLNDWVPFGIHLTFDLNKISMIDDAYAYLTVSTEIDTYIDFISFDFDVIHYEDFISDRFYESFFQKTSLSVPTLYYFKTELDVEKYCISDVTFEIGQLMVLKSCNRCGRYVPINIHNEMQKLGYALHCKKRAPCTHSTFRSYKIENLDECDQTIMSEFNIENGRVISYYGHQLECRACKKFYVNEPLNPMRDAQQHREDSIRRRAIEVLVNNLLGTNTIHNEFKAKGIDFVPYILDKFNHRCFKCGLEVDETTMDLDHTMPLAYLYRLDNTATCLCKSCNSKKHDHFPSDYYSESELIELGKITGLSMEILHCHEVNPVALEKLIQNIEWYFDEFLMDPDYQKIRKGVLTADKINNSLQKVIGNRVNLIEEYKKRTGHMPHSINSQSYFS